MLGYRFLKGRGDPTEIFGGVLLQEECTEDTLTTKTEGNEFSEETDVGGSTWGDRNRSIKHF